MGEEGSQEGNSVVLSFSTPGATPQRSLNAQGLLCHHRSRHTVSVATAAMGLLFSMDFLFFNGLFVP